MRRKRRAAPCARRAHPVVRQTGARFLILLCEKRLRPTLGRSLFIIPQFGGFQGAQPKGRRNSPEALCTESEKPMSRHNGASAVSPSGTRPTSTSNGELRRWRDLRKTGRSALKERTARRPREVKAPPRWRRCLTTASLRKCSKAEVQEGDIIDSTAEIVADAVHVKDQKRRRKRRRRPFSSPRNSDGAVERGWAHRRCVEARCQSPPEALPAEDGALRHLGRPPLRSACHVLRRSDALPLRRSWPTSFSR